MIKTTRNISINTHPNILISELQIGDIVNGKEILNIREGKSKRTIFYAGIGQCNPVGKRSKVFNP